MIDAASSSQLSIRRSAWNWWNEVAAREGYIAATRRLLLVLLEFVRDSTPERRRSRFGDAEFDWEHRVNTTSGGVSWRDRLLGMFHSPYQPTEPALFQEMIGALCAQESFDPREFTFIDLGSGKGRTLLMAADYPFRRILGVEILPALHREAENNIGKYASDSRKCFTLESTCQDAGEFSFPAEPLVLFLFNPFPESLLRLVLVNLARSLQAHPRKVLLLYHNPLLESVLRECIALAKIGGTHQYALYKSR
jgi:SAM-dependent methyltransferase